MNSELELLKQKRNMKTGCRIILATAIITAVVVAIKVSQKKNTERRLANIADEGYETANDILYPQHKFGQDKRLRYGPVLPL
ncbi:MAG: hypothetical protein ABIN67_04135 [Ferruginibacter sp.]